MLAIDRATGRTVWQRTATTATPHEGYHRSYGSFASNSPVTDGKRIYAFFGSRGLFVYSLDGDLLWQKDFGVKLRMDNGWGEGTAPTLHDNRLILHFDHLDGGFLTMLDAETGRELWRVPRTERYNWAAPFVATHGGRRQIVVNGETTRAYDFDTGALIWEAAGLGENSVPQMVQHRDLVFAMSGHTIKLLMAIRLGRTGVLTGTDAIAWSTARGVSYTPSPLLHDGRLYVVSDAGLVSCFDAMTGRPLLRTAPAAQAVQLQGVARRRERQALPRDRGGRRRRAPPRRSIRSAGDQHADGSVVHRVAAGRRRVDLPAQPHALVSDRTLTAITAGVQPAARSAPRQSA